jgi:hypothetical protein
MSDHGEDINRIFGKTIELEIQKRMVGSLTGLQEMSVRTLWRGWPPLKWEDTTSGVRSRDVGAPVTLRSDTPSEK